MSAEATRPVMVTRAERFSEAARRYSLLEWALVPLDGKKGRNGWNKARPESADLAAGKFSAWGQAGRNLGVLLGPSSLAVVDEDEAGALDVLFGDGLPLTPRLVSGSGKRHVYFLAPAGLERQVEDGLELRAGTCLCVLPPSVHPDSGREYAWVHGCEPWVVGLAPLPAHVLAHFSDENGQAPRSAPATPNSIPEGQRRDALLTLAGRMRHWGLSAEEMLPSLLAVNARRCAPPLPESEVRAVAVDLERRYEPSKQLAPKPVPAPRRSAATIRYLTGRPPGEESPC